LHLDVLRGLAILGVLLVNVGYFSGSTWALDAGLPYPVGRGGPAWSYLLAALVENKAAALLAMLFGVGLAIQLGSVERKGRSYARFAGRRAAALALIGLAHSFLLWNGDILFDYALISLLVLPFIRLPAARILWAIPVLLLAAFLLAALVMSLVHAADQDPASVYRLGLQHYGAGTWSEALRFRSWELVHFMAPERLSSRLPLLLPFFVLGVYFWKKGYIANPEAHVRALRILFAACFLLGVLSNLIPEEALRAWANQLPLRPLRILVKLIDFFARMGLSVGYAAGVLLLLQRPWWRSTLAVLAPLGRMALTQYLLQSLVCTWIFNGHGLGLYGRVSVNACLLGGIGLFALQVWSSRMWLTHHSIGPVEWLWRRMTYGLPAHRVIQPP
jgi:uncharacterized protein